jgi:hypothetical protein
MAIESPATPPAPKRVNLRRPGVMEAVAAQVVAHYRSELVERIRAQGGQLSHGGLTIKLAKEFGFCYGVERAIDLAYAARRCFPAPARIFLLGEIIHNPEVNDQIRNLGIVSISPKPDDEELARLGLGVLDPVDHVRVRLGVLRGDVLCEGAAVGDRQDLAAAADAEDRDALLERGMGDAELEGIVLGRDGVDRRVRRLAVVRRIDVLAARQHNAVKVFE